MITGNPSKQVLKAVRRGRTDEVPALLKPLDAAERKALLVELKALRAELRSSTRWDWEWRRGMQALRVAGVGCQTGAAAAATWIGARDMPDWGGGSHPAVLEVLADRAPAWLGDLARRLADRRAFVEAEYGLVHALVLRSGCETPTSDWYVAAWTQSLDRRHLVSALQEHPHTAVLVPRLFDLVETPEPLVWHHDVEAGSWPSALAALAAEGLFDRRDLIEGCLARLVRGGRPRDLRFPLALVQRLEPTGQELREHTADWLGMVADAPSTVAGYAQQVLAPLALSGELPDARLAEMSGALFFRTEKKLVRAQLTLLGKVLKKRPDVAPELLPVIAEAFGHADSDVQERALKLVGDHLSAVDEGVRGELAAAAELLGPLHRPRAAELFGASLPQEPAPAYEEFLPPVPERRRLSPAAGTVPELLEELVPLVNGRRRAPAEAFERVLDGLVRHAARDRAALAEAVGGAFANAWWMKEPSHLQSAGHFHGSTFGLDVVLAALLGQVRQEYVDAGRAREHVDASCSRHVLDGVLEQRLWEAADLIGTPGLPFLLATPTWHTGALDAGELAERLRLYRDAGCEPAPADFAQALLRVRRDGPAAAEAARAAAALGTTAGDRLAARLADPATLAPTVRVTPRVHKAAADGRWFLAERIVLTTRERLDVQRDFPGAFQWLGRPLDPSPRDCRFWSDERENLPAVLPLDREALAAWLLPQLAAEVEWEARGAGWWLTALAEADGEVGPAVHLALACGLAGRHAEDRLTAVDALLVLAARGDLYAAGLGATLAGLVQEGFAKPNRVADAARTAAATGAYATVWSVLAPLLPGLLAAEKPVRGLGEVLAVAAECAERCRPGGAIPGLDRLAGRGGSSQAVVQAKRLSIALAYGLDQSATEPAEKSQ